MYRRWNNAIFTFKQRASSLDSHVGLNWMLKLKFPFENVRFLTIYAENKNTLLKLFNFAKKMMFQSLKTGYMLVEADTGRLEPNCMRLFFYLRVSSYIRQVTMQLSHLTINKLSYVTPENYNIHTCLFHALRDCLSSLFFKIAWVLYTLNSK